NSYRFRIEPLKEYGQQAANASYDLFLGIQVKPNLLFHQRIGTFPASDEFPLGLPGDIVIMVLAEILQRRLAMSHDKKRFEEAYASEKAPWDSGVVSAELLRVVGTGKFGPSLLELGCGTGTNAIELARRGYRVTAVDYVEQAIQTARRKAQAAG